MFEVGSKLKHVKSPAFVNEMVDAFNVTAIHTGTGPKVMITAGRDTVDVLSETFVQKDGGITTEGKDDDSQLYRFSVANLTIPLEAARGLAKALQETIDKYDTQLAAITAGTQAK
ncbi:hypothetical protein [Pseudomonas abietaniphila]|uniref:Uncharacterized protein n=1 Tax=Pseudomonas abietaniphila TaxID=89065 RepID=A0A1G8TDX7_9PSED|nr:hypothetical protein [Pseudomonas abietaniphila]SDJ39597.1 hypothetical protein SAMN05216605_12847 [Pseudomonas abietaniphila]